MRKMDNCDQNVNIDQQLQANVHLLIHTMTITDTDYIMQAQFVHTFTYDDLIRLNNARLVGRRFVLRIHPRLRRNISRGKMILHQLNMPNLRTIMKRNSANIKHNLRAVSINSPRNLKPIPLIEKADSPLQVNSGIPAQLPSRPEVVKNDALNDHQLHAEATPEQTVDWLTINRFTKYIETFSSFSGSDMLRMSREDFIQICGHADGIRLYNALHSKSIAPKLRIYVCRNNSSVFNAIFLSTHSNVELMQKLSLVVGISLEQIQDVYMEGPQSIHVQLNNDVLRHIKEDTMFSLEVIQEGDRYILLLKKAVKN